MSSRLTVFCHYYNEEYMLQWWLPHHAKLFDHGVMIDYGSTDSSNDLIRRFAPHWQIHKSRNPDFDAAACDQEVMELERMHHGWKMVLNTTEFLCVRSKHDLIENLKRQGSPMYRTTGITMVDPPGMDHQQPNPDRELVKQRHMGFVRRESNIGWNTDRDRLIHNHGDGAYSIGRHFTNFPEPPYLHDAFTLHFQYSPWNETMIQRKLFIQTRIPEHNRQRGWSVQHFVDRPRLHQMYMENVARATDLRQRGDCGWIFT